jgi:putative FmdB family regulatory protein
MPAYDFYCQKCKKDFCLTLSIEGYEKKNFSCPHCKGKEIRRVPSAFIARTSRKN